MHGPQTSDYIMLVIVTMCGEMIYPDSLGYYQKVTVGRQILLKQLPLFESSSRTVVDECGHS